MSLLAFLADCLTVSKCGQECVHVCCQEYRRTRPQPHVHAETNCCCHACEIVYDREPQPPRPQRNENGCPFM